MPRFRRLLSSKFLSTPDPAAPTTVLHRGLSQDDTFDFRASIHSVRVLSRGGNDVVDGSSHNDFLDGGAGDDWLEGWDGNDIIKGGAGSDILRGGKGNDTVYGGVGNDILKGSDGSDKLYGGNGDDYLVYYMAENQNAVDSYEGGHGVDTLKVRFSKQEWLDDTVQSDVKDFLAWTKMDHPNELIPFKFTAFDLTVRNIEKFDVYVNDQQLTPEDDPVTAVDDQVTVSEDQLEAFSSVLDNDDVPDLVRKVELLQGPTDGVLTFNPGTDVSPDGSFSFDPDGQFEFLAEGETADVSFGYRVTDSDYDTGDATATITVSGKNDAPVAQAFSHSLSEDLNSFTISASSGLWSDVDNGAVLDVDVFGVPIDDKGRQLGRVEVDANNNIVFYTNDDFEFLDQGESHNVTIDYKVTDEHGAQDVNKLTFTIEGAYDAPITTQDRAVFTDTDQSMWTQGDAKTLAGTIPLMIDPDPLKIDSGPLKDTDIDLKAGLMLYYSFGGGDLDSNLGFDVKFNTPKQVLGGEQFTMSTSLAMLEGAGYGFNATGPGVKLAADVLMDLDVNLSLQINPLGETKVCIPFFECHVVDLSTPPYTTKQHPTNITIEENSAFAPEGETSIERGTNLFSFDSKVDGAIKLPTIAGGVTPTLRAPDFDAVGQVSNSMVHTKNSTKILELDADVDSLIINNIPQVGKALNAISEATLHAITIDGLNMKLDVSNVMKGNLDLFSFNVIPTLSAVQDLVLGSTELRYDLYQVNGTTRNKVGDDLVVGDDVTLTAPDNIDRLHYEADLDLSATLNNKLSLALDGTMAAKALEGKLDVAGISDSFGPVLSYESQAITEAIPELKKFLTTSPLYDQTFDLAFDNTHVTDFYIDVA